MKSSDRRDYYAKQCEEAYFNGETFLGHNLGFCAGIFKAGWDARGDIDTAVQEAQGYIEWLDRENKRLREALGKIITMNDYSEAEEIERIAREALKK